MTDESPKADTYEVLKRAEAQLAAQIEDALKEGGKKTVKVRCQACATDNYVELESFNADERVKALSATSQALDRMRKSQKDDDASAAATKLIHDFSQMSQAELAEYIVTLEADLAA